MSINFSFVWKFVLMHLLGDLGLALHRMAGSYCAVTPVSMHTTHTASHHLCLKYQKESGPASGVPVSLSLDEFRRSSFGGET